MLMMNDPSLLYKKASVETLSPGRIILLLFNTALSSLEKAEEAYLSGFSVRGQEVFHNNLQKVENILRELQNCLRYNYAKELADTLYRLYDYLCEQLSTFRMKKNKQCLENSKKILTELRDGWREMLQHREG